MTILRRTEEMANNVADQLRNVTSNFVSYSLALDESTDISGTPQLAIFIRGVDENLVVSEELLDFLPLKEGTTGEDIFSCVEEVIERVNLQWDKLVSVTTDGAPAMAGRFIGLVGRIQSKVKNLVIPREIIVIHCLIHQEHLCAKSVELSDVMTVVVQTTNFIRHNGNKRRQFKTFLEELDAEYGELPYHTEVRWLSRGKVLDRFFHLREDIDIFMNCAGRPVPQLGDNAWIRDLAFLSDIVDHLSKLNVSLQGRDRTIIELFDSIQLFKAQLHLFMGHLRTQVTFHFPKLESVSVGNNLNFNRYADILQTLHDEFSSRFQDVMKIDKELSIIVAPFQCDANLAPAHLQLEILDLQNNRLLKLKNGQYENVLEFYQYLPRTRFPKLHQLAATIKSIFASTYVCEQLFSAMKRVKSAHRSRLTDSNLKKCLVLSTCQNIVPDIPALVQIKKRRILKETSTVVSIDETTE